MAPASSTPTTSFTIPPLSTLSLPPNSTTLITGGTSGIGLSTALALHSTSPTHNLILLDRSPLPSASSSALPSSFLTSPRILHIPCDITSWNSQRDAFAKGAAHFGRIDAVFVNAGIAEWGDQFFDTRVDGEGRPVEPDRRTVDVDLRAAGDTVKLAVWWLKKNEVRKHNGRGADARKPCRGSIVLTASLAGYLASAGAPLYSAAKHGIVGLMRALKNDLATLNIAVSLVAPGITLTDIVSGRKPGQSLKEWATDMRGRGVPINEPGEVAEAVVWLVSRGMETNGAGLVVQAGRCADVEAGIAKNRHVWMGEEMLRLFRGGREAPLFPNKL